MIARKLWKWEDRCIFYDSDSTKTHRRTGGSQEAVNDGLVVFCPNPSQIVFLEVMPTVPTHCLRCPRQRLPRWCALGLLAGRVVVGDAEFTQEFNSAPFAALAAGAAWA